MDFPLEVVDLIISYCYFNVYALKASSLVCRSWVPSCRVQLFRHLQLRPTGRDSPENWNRFLSSSVNIIPYIAEISILCERSSWVVWDPILPALLGKLQNIEQIELLGCDLPGFPAPLSSAIYTLFRSPSTKCISLRLCVLPSSYSDLFSPSLDSLLLSDVVLDPEATVASGEPSHPPRPKCLTIEGKSVTNIIDWLVPSSEGDELEGLQTLCVKYQGDDEGALKSVERLLQCTGSLKTLDISLYPACRQYTPGICQAPRICYNHQLYDLRLSHFDMDIPSPTNQLPWLGSLLAQMTHLHRVRKITVDARLRPCPGRPTLDRDGWATIDDILAGGVHLRDVHIQTSDAYGASSADISSSMPAMHAKGILRVSM
ncbi:hypothetical protein DFH07DRAFT_856512 [Mycena maculata]|uniref:F-box domain-containing protein n=1 Tax=Mycena maculata TaxID=230809 RepID=A0AAD7HKE1_9AGAR|nr:hypothetical protein DFH07DRAFT_856512 [Mycena maculata]